MVFQWFWQRWTITIECFWGGPTIETNGFSMVFKILRAMVNNGLFYPLWSIFSPLWSIFNLIWTLFEKTPFLALVNEFCLGQNDLLYVLKRPLQIFNGFWGDHHHWMFFGQSDHCHQWFYDGFDGSLWSIWMTAIQWGGGELHKPTWIERSTCCVVFSYFFITGIEGDSFLYGTRMLWRLLQENILTILVFWK